MSSIGRPSIIGRLFKYSSSSSNTSTSRICFRSVTNTSSLSCKSQRQAIFSPAPASSTSRCYSSSSASFFSSSPPPSSSSSPSSPTSPLTPPIVPPVHHAAASRAKRPDQQYEGSGVPVYVKAFYVARGLDIFKVHTEVYGAYRQQFHSKSVSISINDAANQHIVIYKYGSVIFFNIPEAEQREHLRRISENAIVAPMLAEGLVFDENYKIVIHENLDKPSVIKAEHLNIKRLDSNNISIVSTVMAQTVALDYYAVAVEKMLEKFLGMNMEMEKNGHLLSNQDSLYKLIASNNTVITNMLAKLGLFEGSDAAWDNADYYYTLETLRKDFELDFRFKDLYLKLDIVKDNTRFFLEMLQDKKSKKLEWTIIVLIAVEIVIGISGLIQSAH